MGPIGFTDIDQQGMLIEGFEEHDLSITLYNYEYYPKHLEKLGFVKDADWVEFQIFMPAKLDERIERISEMVKNRYKFKRVYFNNNKEIYPYAYEALNVINDAFAGLYGQVAMTEEIIDKSVKEYIPIVHKDFIIVITNNDGKVIGVGLLVPSLAKAFKKAKGKLFPFGIFHMLKALKKPEILEMYFIAVLPEYQKMGVNAIIMAEAVKEGIKHNVKFAETGPELDNNDNVIDQWKSFPHRQHRRRRSWIREIE
jgi:ribosomal protein S18 acetylase RimI-like enzyme